MEGTEQKQPWPWWMWLIVILFPIPLRRGHWWLTVICVVAFVLVIICPEARFGLRMSSAAVQE